MNPTSMPLGATDNSITTVSASSTTTSKRSQTNGSSVPLKKRKLRTVVVPKKPSVRFNLEVVEHKPRIFKTPILPSATWLKEKDLIRIREGVLSTLDFIRRRNKFTDEDWNRKKKQQQHTRRGLEDYSLTGPRGSLRSSVVHRRRNAVRTVLHEQERQRSRHKLLHLRANKQIQKQLRDKPRHHSILDHEQIARVYRTITGANRHNAIMLGRVDSIQAFAVYREAHQRPSISRQHRPSLLHERQRSAPVNKPSDTTWGFSGKKKPAPLSRHRRVVSLS